MGTPLSYAAAAASNTLEEQLTRMFLQQMERQKLAQQAGRDATVADLGGRNAATAEGNLQQRIKEFEAASAPKAPEPLKPMSVGGRIVDPNTGKVIFEPPKETPAATPVMRINPRTGKMEQLGEAPKGAHFVNEPPPQSQGPTHARYSISDGTTEDGKPVKIRMNVDTGQIEAVPLPSGVSAPKREGPVTQDQSNLGLYANRVEQADPILKTLEASITKMNPLSFAAQLKADHPKLQSAEIQQYNQAARNFINAVLRRESGAAIAESEFNNARGQYLPVPGDSPQVLAQKAENRRIVLENYKRGAGPAYKPMTPAGGGGGNNDAAKRAADLIKKYGGG